MSTSHSSTSRPDYLAVRQAERGLDLPNLFLGLTEYKLALPMDQKYMQSYCDHAYEQILLFIFSPSRQLDQGLFQRGMDLVEFYASHNRLRLLKECHQTLRRVAKKRGEDPKVDQSAEVIKARLTIKLLQDHAEEHVRNLANLAAYADDSVKGRAMHDERLRNFITNPANKSNVMRLLQHGIQPAGQTNSPFKIIGLNDVTEEDKARMMTVSHAHHLAHHIVFGNQPDHSSSDHHTSSRNPDFDEKSELYQKAHQVIGGLHHKAGLNHMLQNAAWSKSYARP